MKTTIGPEGLTKSWQAAFPALTPCCRCGGEARHAFTAHEGHELDDRYPEMEGKLICDIRCNGVKGDYWPHDRCAVAVYFCRECLETTALYNQA